MHAHRDMQTTTNTLNTFSLVLTPTFDITLLFVKHWIEEAIGGLWPTKWQEEMRAAQLQCLKQDWWGVMKTVACAESWLVASNLTTRSSIHAHPSTLIHPRMHTHSSTHRCMHTGMSEDSCIHPFIHMYAQTFICMHTGTPTSPSLL